MEPSVPDYFERIAGVRIWRVAPNLWAQLGGLLWAPALKEPWPTGEEFIAHCSTVPDHVPPADGCMCGIYAFNTPQAAITGGYWPHEQRPYFNRIVAGVVGAAGEVVLQEHGYRAARVRVEAIFEVGVDDHELPIPRQEIASAYDVNLIHVDEYETFCRDQGLVLLS